MGGVLSQQCPRQLHCPSLDTSIRSPVQGSCEHICSHVVVFTLLSAGQAARWHRPRRTCSWAMDDAAARNPRRQNRVPNRQFGAFLSPELCLRARSSLRKLREIRRERASARWFRSRTSFFVLHVPLRVWRVL